MTNNSPLPKALPFVFPGLFLLLSIVLSFNGLYGQESFECLNRSASVFNFWHGTPAPVQGAIGLYPFLGALFRFVSGDQLVALHLLSGLSYAGLLWFFERVLRLLSPGSRISSRWAFVSIGLGLSPSMVLSGCEISAETTALMFMTGAWYFALLAPERPRMAFPAAAMAVFALMTESRYLITVLPLLLWMGYGSRPRGRWKAVLWTVLGAGLACLPFFWLKSAFPSHTMAFPAWSAGNLFRRSFPGEYGLVQHLLPNGLHALTVFAHPFLGLTMAGLYLLFKRTDLLLGPKRVLAFSILGYLLLIAGLPQQDSRLLLPAYLLLLWILFPAWDRFYCYGFLFFPRLTRFLLGISLACQLFFSAWLLAPSVAQNRLEREIAEDLRQKIPVGAPCYTLGLDPALQYYLPECNIRNLGEQLLTAFPPGTFVLFNETWPGKQSSGNAWKNWEYLNTNEILEKRGDYGQGWILYVVQ